MYRVARNRDAGVTLEQIARDFWSPQQRPSLGLLMKPVKGHQMGSRQS
jgi:hypothetical protein